MTQKATWEEELYEYMSSHAPDDSPYLNVVSLIKANFIPISTLHTLEEKIRGMRIGLYDGENPALDSVLQEIRKIYE